jgi:hypothetical protein
MTALRVTPLIISSLLLAAHFYRGGGLVLTAICLAAPFLLITRRLWAVQTLQVALFVGAAEWIRTALVIGSIRSAMGQPSLRMFLILAGVALFTTLAALPLGGLRVRVSAPLHTAS